MSLAANLIRFAIKITPNSLIVWVANHVMKGIAELTQFNFDLDARKVYVQSRLYGEDFTIDVVLEDFAVFNDGESYRFILHHAHSDRPWLQNILAKFVGKAWKIPAIPGFTKPLALAAEVFAAQAPALHLIEGEASAE
ncbi:hypothetical protein PL263_18670 [Methylomonas sp. EFPC3]|uniref:hypothetical protein n=1 Tax=Methylomonas sp. EFPC3 TaxID=3021710 RepID=UPI0024175132|nr:hypothetical protein [Methylomonas sp. EFPC3]WFP50103.1 hypothetical protein PL263_18670 [Methylomonas sp. EFPC3]